jgi:hypothetical protein
MILRSSISRLALGLALLAGGASLAQAQDSGPLIDALVRKGILTDQEGEELRADLLRDFGTTSPGKLDISTSVTRLRLSGDARVRYQFDNQKTDPAGAAGDRDRNRYRYRVRFGAIADLGPKWSAGFRLETQNSATSTNADLGGTATENFSKVGDEVYFGQAYINFKDEAVLGFDAVDFRAGRLPHKFFTPGVNGFWIDSDINFEGLAEEVVWNDIGVAGSTLSLRAGQFVLNNNAGAAGATGATPTNRSVDPSLLHIIQAEYATKSLKIAPTFVTFGAPSEYDRGVAAPRPDAGLYSELNAILVPAEYSFTLNGQPAAVYATYGHNFASDDRKTYLAPGTAVSDDASLYNLGVRYGQNRNAGDYQLTAEYRHVGNAAFSSFLLDSDFAGGGLNASGIIVSGSYSWTPAVMSTVTFFRSTNNDRIGTAGYNSNFSEAQVVQVDLSARF